jgi:hypothetical protein
LLSKSAVDRNSKATSLVAIFLPCLFQRVTPVRKEFNVRIRLPSHLGDEIHKLSLQANRSQSATVSWLVTEQLNAMRARATEQAELLDEGQKSILQRRLTALLRGLPSDAQ